MKGTFLLYLFLYTLYYLILNSGQHVFSLYWHLPVTLESLLFQTPRRTDNLGVKRIKGESTCPQ